MTHHTTGSPVSQIAGHCPPLCSRGSEFGRVRMPSAVTDDPPEWIAANADTEQTDADNEPPPSPLILPAAANAKEAHGDGDAAGAAVDAR